MNKDTSESIGYVAIASVVITLILSITSCGRATDATLEKRHLACIQAGKQIISGNCVR